MTRRARKRLALVAAAGTVIGLGAYGGYTLRQAQKQRLIERMFDQGMAAYQAHDYEAARTALNHYVRSRPGNAAALLALADSTRRVPMENDGHIGGAILHARQAAEAAETDEERLPALRMLLELYGITGYMTERLETAQRILKIQPDHAGAMSARIESMIVLGRRAEALEAARQMAAALPDNMDAHSAVVGLMEVQGSPGQDILAYTRDLAARYPQSLRAAALHARAVLRFATMDEAMDLARQAVPVSAESVEAVAEFLALLDTLGLEEEAAEVLVREIHNEAFGTRVAILAAERAWKSGRAPEARRYIDPVAATGEDEALGWAAFLEADGQGAAEPGAALAALAGRATTAASFWREVVAGVTAARGSDPAEARERLRSALALRPESTLAEFLLGRVHESVGDWVSAVVRWRSVVYRDPGHRLARLAMVSTLLRNGRIDDAAAQARQALAARSGLMEVYSVSRAFVAAIEAGRSAVGEFERVVGVLENLRGRPATDPVVLPLLARAYLGVGRTAEAEEVVRAIIDEGLATSSDDVIGLVTVLQRTSPDLAAALLEAARRAAPDDGNLAYIGAVAAAQAGRADEGRRTLEEAVAAAEGDAKALAELQLAVYLDRAGYPEARERLAALAAAAPSDARMQLAVLESQSAWEDEATVAAAIGRLRALAGESSPLWKLHEARRMLLFARDAEHAAKVVQLLADLLRTDPDSPAGMTLMADAMLLLDDRAKAIDFLGRVMDSNPIPAMYPTLVGLLRESGRTDDVQRRLREFLRLGPIPLELRRTRAQLLAANGMMNEAMSEFEALAAGGNPADQLNLARICIRRGNLARAESILETLLAATDPAVPAVLAAAELAAMQGRVDHGLALLDRLPATLAPHERDLHLAAYLDRNGRTAEAEAAYRRAAAGGDPAASAALVGFYITRGRHDDADAALASALAVHKDHPDLLRLQGVARVARGGDLPVGAMTDVAALVIEEGDERTRQRFLDAMKAWESNPSDRATLLARLRRITETSPTFYPAWYFLVSILLEDGSTPQAAQAARVAARVLPTDPRVARLAVAALARNGELIDALDMAYQWRERLVGVTLDADVAIAELNGLLNQHAKGLAALEPWRDRILAEADAAPDRVVLLATLMARSGREEEAHAMLWPLAERTPRFASAYLRIAQQLDDAPAVRRQWVERVEPLLAGRQDAALDLARAWYMIATEGGESEALRRVVALLGDNPDRHADKGEAALLLAASHDSLGNAQEALRFYRAALELSPNEPMALNNFAYLLVNSGGSAEEALKAAQQAVGLAAQGNLPAAYRASFLDTLGVIHLRLEQFEAAEKVFRDAIALSPQDIGLLVGAAEAQARGGNAEAATKTIGRIDAMISRGAAVSPAIEGRLQSVRRLLNETGVRPN